MRCTSCTRVVRPVVAVDIDGTIADYHRHFLNFLESYLGEEPLDPFPSYDGTLSFKVWCMKEYGIDEADWSKIKLAYRQGGQKRNMPIFSWAQPMIYFIRAAGAELWITTTRPYQRLDNIDPDTQAWLDRYHVEYDGLIYDKYKYRMLAEQVDPARVVAAVDDLYDKYLEAASIFGQAAPILKLGEYNSGAIGRGPLVAFPDLRQVTAEILNRINNWKELHQ